MLEEEFDFIMEVLESELRPYRDSHHVYRKLPEKGKAHEDILTEMNELAVRERAKWHSGYVSGAVYNGDDSHIDFLNEVYSINSMGSPI